MIVPHPRPLIEPGTYEAVSASVRRGRFWDRLYMEIVFTVFRGPFSDGEVVAAGVQGFFSMGAINGTTGPGRASKLVRLIQVYDPAAKPEKVRAQDLKDKAWLVEVVTVTQDKDKKDLPKANQYSKVGRVIERLA